MRFILVFSVIFTFALPQGVASERTDCLASLVGLDLLKRENELEDYLELFGSQSHIPKLEAFLKKAQGLQKEYREWRELLKEAIQTGEWKEARDIRKLIRKIFDQLKEEESRFKGLMDRHYKIKRDSYGGISKISPPKSLMRDPSYPIHTLSVTSQSRGHSESHFLKSVQGLFEGKELDEFVNQGKLPKRLAGRGFFSRGKTLNTYFPQHLDFDSVLQRMVEPGSSWVRKGEINSNGFDAFRVDFYVNGKKYRSRVVVCVSGPCVKKGQKGEILSIIPRCGPDILYVPSATERARGRAARKGVKCD